MEVQCTGNQLMAPVPEPCKKKMVRLQQEEEEEEEEEEGQIAEAGQTARKSQPVRRRSDGKKGE